MLNEEFAAASNWVAAMSQEDLRAIKRKHWTFLLHERNYECGELEFRKYVARKLSDFPLPALVSPLHDRDVKDDGTLVVPHVHVIVMFEQPQRYSTALAQLKYGCDFHTLNYLQPVANLRALAVSFSIVYSAPATSITSCTEYGTLSGLSKWHK